MPKSRKPRKHGPAGKLGGRGSPAADDAPMFGIEPDTRSDDDDGHDQVCFSHVLVDSLLRTAVLRPVVEGPCTTPCLTPCTTPCLAPCLGPRITHSAPGLARPREWGSQYSAPRVVGYSVPYQINSTTQGTLTRMCVFSSIVRFAAAGTRHIDAAAAAAAACASPSFTVVRPSCMLL